MKCEVGRAELMAKFWIGNLRQLFRIASQDDVFYVLYRR